MQQGNSVSSGKGPTEGQTPPTAKVAAAVCAQQTPALPASSILRTCGDSGGEGAPSAWTGCQMFWLGIYCPKAAMRLRFLCTAAPSMLPPLPTPPAHGRHSSPSSCAASSTYGKLLC